MCRGCKAEAVALAGQPVRLGDPRCGGLDPGREFLIINRAGRAAFALATRSKASGDAVLVVRNQRRASSWSDCGSEPSTRSGRKLVKLRLQGRDARDVC